MSSNVGRMNRAKVLSQVRNFNMQYGDCIVIAGSAMVILGLRETTSDIDIVVSPKIYEAIKQKHGSTKLFDPDMEVTKLGTLDISDSGYGTTDYIVVDGVKTMTPKALLAFKKSLNRPKDQEDIINLERYLKTMEKF